MPPKAAAKPAAAAPKAAAAPEPAAPAPAPVAAAPPPPKEKKAVKQNSNVYSLFEKKQIQEYKEAFGLMDQDRDGVISVDDLREVFSSLGKVPKDSELKAMLDEAAGPMNFTMMLSLFGENLGGTDEEPVINNAFKLYDADAKGALHKDVLRNILCNEGHPHERLTDDEFNQMCSEAPVDGKGMLDYAAFTKIIKRGKEDEEQT